MSQPFTPTQEQRDQMVADFEALLREQSGIDAADRDALMHHFTRALDEAKPDDVADPQALMANLSQTLDVLQENRVIQAGDRDGLSKAFAEPLNNPTVKRALEFAQRRQRDGEEQALEWLQSQADGENAGSKGSSATPAPPAGLPSSLGAKRPVKTYR
ncbi:hypothetical protein K4L06_07975 [Lysobacter sp. BMK333-48F3]|uniref:hypothetical protein n=1 Tax=Lysobacter sp. BMK333-48F3 TaxID=2867962 RepID=UPI001C8B4C70|nr:hypothetical protein [Lysobacter sp. BMK333-48F3]MBX9401249.1 hypothetical protein [Lysobacter sp. BMK333-48F3]